MFSVQTATGATRRVMFDSIPEVLKPVGLPIVSSDFPKRGADRTCGQFTIGGRSR